MSAPQDQVEDAALRIVREYGVRAMDAWHLAVALLVLPPLLEQGEEPVFASRDDGQSAAARTLGLTVL